MVTIHDKGGDNVRLMSCDDKENIDMGTDV